MDFLAETLDAMQLFLDTGGPVLWIIGGVAAVMGFMIVERYWFMLLVFPRYRQHCMDTWQSRSDPHAWPTLRLREAMLSECSLRLRSFLPALKMLVALCPLLGLLGTVTGMIQVFDVVSTLGTGNARAMASGISRATIPTMAGMVVALPGLYFCAQLEQFARRKTDELADLLRHEQEARA